MGMFCTRYWEFWWFECDFIVCFCCFSFPFRFTHFLFRNFTSIGLTLLADDVFSSLTNLLNLPSFVAFFMTVILLSHFSITFLLIYQRTCSQDKTIFNPCFSFSFLWTFSVIMSVTFKSFRHVPDNVFRNARNIKYMFVLLPFWFIFTPNCFFFKQNNGPSSLSMDSCPRNIWGFPKVGGVFRYLFFF